jgi:hypothetical protein
LIQLFGHIDAKDCLEHGLRPVASIYFREGNECT